MSNELKILRLFCDSRIDFTKGEPYLGEIKNLEREIKVILSLIKRFYNHYDEKNIISYEDLKTYYDLLYPSSREREIYLEIMGAIFREEVSSEIIKDLIEQIIEQHYAAQIMFKLTSVVDGSAPGKLLSIQDDINIYLSKLRNPPQKTASLTPFQRELDQLVKDEMNESDSLQWFLPKLNELIGGIRRGTLGVIFGFVDAGKTSFGIKSCVNFASQLSSTERIVYAGNEEAGSRVSFRMVQSSLEKTRHEISNSIETSRNDLQQLGFDRILLYDSITHISQIETLLQSIRPRILFIDQGTKVHTDSTNLSEVGEAQLLFNWYRERAKLYNTSIICLAQATGEAENRKYLKLSDIYGSRVSIQGELDYAIGIGKLLDDFATLNHRFVNIPKNKMKDGKKGRFITEFSEERCSFKEI